MPGHWRYATPRSMLASISLPTSFAEPSWGSSSAWPPAAFSGCRPAGFNYNPILLHMLELIILFFLIFLNGLFVMAEIALVSARKSRLENLADNGDIKARAALRLAESPELFLST